MSFGGSRAGWMVMALLLSWGVANEANARSYQQIYKFPGNSSCCFPESLIRAPNGSLFGVQGYNYFDPFDSQQGAGNGVFELDPPAPGQTAWTYSLIYSYVPGYNLPGQPPGFMNPELLMDKSGNLYFGTGTGVYQHETAAVVELSPPAPGSTAWTQTILYDHHSPTGPNIGSFHLTYINSGGTLFGYDDKGDMPPQGGDGAVFAVQPRKAGQTQGTVSVLSRFTGEENVPRSLLLGADNSFYGLAYAGYISNQRGGLTPAVVAFRLTPPADGQTAWTRSTIFSFDVNGYSDGLGPLIADRSLNMYGVAQGIGNLDGGYVYKLTPPATGQTAWQRTVLYDFPYANSYFSANGAALWGKLVNWNGILLGTAGDGGVLYGDVGCTGGCGTVFRLSAISPGSPMVPWNVSTLYKFEGGPYDGAKPYGPVIPVTQTDGSLALFGITLAGGHQNGEDGNGIVYELIP
jgi:hypothetical protein